MDFPFVFTRFCHFFGYLPDQVLALPVRLFFMMERQIPRVRAEGDMRRLAVQSCSMSGENAEKVHQVLIAEQGEVYTLTRETNVKPEPGALERLKAMQ